MIQEEKMEGVSALPPLHRGKGLLSDSGANGTEVHPRNPQLEVN